MKLFIFFLFIGIFNFSAVTDQRSSWVKMKLDI